MKQVDLGLAMRAMIETCKKIEDCRKCPIIEVCGQVCPLEWDRSRLPEVGECMAILITVD